MVIWLTGLSGSGKTTLAKALRELLSPACPGLVMLDGDDVRAAFGDGLGHREKDRVVQVTRVQRLAKMLSDQDLVVIVALVYANGDLLDWNRAHISEYFEIHVNASLETVSGRDTKGLYAAALRGEKTDVYGVDIPIWTPNSPDLTVNADKREDPIVVAQRVVASAPRLAALIEGGNRA